MLKLDQIQRLYFLGVGGIGMSALARYFRHLGKEVFGYDRVNTSLTRLLEDEGVQIHYKDDASSIPGGIDLVVWTPAIPESLGEMQFFRKKGIPMMKRSEILGLISQSKNAIGVSGTHGKTTTSIMLSYLMKEGGIDTAAFLGGISKNFQSNFVAGQSDWVVMEADEFDRSFWRLFPRCTIVTSMDADHLDVYGDHEEMIRSYKVFVAQTQDDGCLIYHDSLKEVLGGDFLNALSDRGIECISFGLNAGQSRSEITRIENGFIHFDFSFEEIEIRGLKMRMPGEHNVSNMTAALTMALRLGIRPERCREILPGFKGIDRRFEIHELRKGRYLINDYAHHPKELEAAIKAARNFFPGNKIAAVFQPHLFSRTKDFGEGFAEAMDRVDQPILVELYPAREEPIPGIDSGYLLDLMGHPDKKLTTKKELINQLNREEIEVIMILGAGDLDVLIPDIINALEKHE
jgi:UDP-N-acetylmuramate--alanine ligase